MSWISDITNPISAGPGVCPDRTSEFCCQGYGVSDLRQRKESDIIANFHFSPVMDTMILANSVFLMPILI